MSWITEPEDAVDQLKYLVYIYDKTTRNYIEYKKKFLSFVTRTCSGLKSDQLYTCYENIYVKNKRLVDNILSISDTIKRIENEIVSTYLTWSIFLSEDNIDDIFLSDENKNKIEENNEKSRKLTEREGTLAKSFNPGLKTMLRGTHYSWNGEPLPDEVVVENPKGLLKKIKLKKQTSQKKLDEFIEEVEVQVQEEDLLKEKVKGIITDSIKSVVRKTPEVQPGIKLNREGGYKKKSKVKSRKLKSKSNKKKLRKLKLKSRKKY